MTKHGSVSYLDASAAVKLVISELHAAELRQFIAGQAAVEMTDFCFHETLTTLKGLWAGKKNAAGQKIRISDDQYHDACYLFLSYFRNGSVSLDDSMRLWDLKVQREVEIVARKHSIDLSDAFQVVTVLRGRNSCFVGDSASMLISDDDKLVRAARAEGIGRVWFLRDRSTMPRA